MPRPSRAAAPKSFTGFAPEGESPESGPSSPASAASFADSELRALSDPDDEEFEVGSVAEELDLDMDVDGEDDEDYDLAESPGKKKGKAKMTPRLKGRTTGNSTPSRVGTPVGTPGPRINWDNMDGPKRAASIAMSNSELLTFPPRYRDYLLAASTALARGNTERAPPTTSRVPVFPLGPVTPFTTHLLEAPTGGKGKVQVIDDAPDLRARDTARRDESREAAKRLAALIPWERWEGEAWFKEMFTDDNEFIKAVSPTKKGKEKAVNPEAANQLADGMPPGWKWREDVRLGLDGVGRLTAGSVISAAEAASYLPKAETVKVHYGPLGSEALMEMNRFDTHAFSVAAQTSSGVMVAAGGQLQALDWCPYPDRLAAKHGYAQYIAISTITHDPPIGARVPPNTKATIQIWSVRDGSDGQPGTAACDIVLCIEGGAALDVKWMPLGAWDELEAGVGLPKLGILAAAQCDGTISLYPVPHPSLLREACGQSSGPVYLRSPALLKLNVADATPLCVEWLSGLRIASGMSNGHIAVWDVNLKNTSADPLPSIFAAVGHSPMSSISAGRVPPTTSTGKYDYAGDAVYVAFSTWDGLTGILDLRDPSTVHEVNRGRLPSMACKWVTQMGTVAYSDGDYMVTLAQLRHVGPLTHHVTTHRGPIWNIDTSDYHTMAASASADGSVVIANFGAGFFRRKNGGLLSHRLYEMDYNEHTGEYRMTDGFMPEQMSLEDAIKHSNKKKTTKQSTESTAPVEGDVAKVKTGAWSQYVGVNRVAWQCGAGLGRAGWLASGGYSGLVRLEQIRGQWTK